MVVKIESPGPLDVEAFTDIATGGVESKPFFYDSGKEGTAAVIRVFDAEGELLSAARLVVDGATGKVKLQDRTAPTKPKRDQDKEAVVPPVPAPASTGVLPPLTTPTTKFGVQPAAKS